ncbi:hypothetical protein [uncultured Friedmanniella sp.]|uniref:hypothetical protein n=1 Tax=uncultured Friedmanniella sp. TaxID=335381 RepID=UPI0035CC4F85
MSGVLHPVGPEPEQTYWIRRALVLGSALLMLVLLVTLVVNATSTGSAASAAPPPVVVPAGATTSASPSPSASASATASAKASAKPSTKASAKTSAKPKASASPSAKKTAAKPAAPVACDPDQLRTTLTGSRQLEPKQHARFRLSLINASGATCLVKVTPDTFKLTIYSGRDRIYSTSDCATAVKPVSKKLAAEADVAWLMAWNGRRSAKGCENRPEIPRAGTYIATAKLDGAKAVTMRIILHA